MVNDQQASEIALELDPAQQSLAEALKVSFGILKIAMIALVVAYALSGVFSVGSNEVALRLRFGDYVGDAGNRVLERGTYFAAPFPFEQVVKVDTRPMRLDLGREFWFEVTSEDSGLTMMELRGREAGPLHPVRDGSLITGDSNIVHAKWAITWRVGDRIGDPENYLTNVGSAALAKAIVRLVAQQGIVHAVARLPAEELLRGTANREIAVGLMQDRLDAMRSGLVIDQLILDKVSAPLSVAGSFDAVTAAESDRARRILAARQRRARVLGETAGEASDSILAVLSAYEDSVARGDMGLAAEYEARLEGSFDELTIDDKRMGGEVAAIINQAKTYRTEVVERVGSEAAAFAELLPQYQRNPRLVLAKLWEDAREGILTGDVETFYTVPGQLELQLNRDPELQKERQQEQLRANRQEQRAGRRGR